MIEKKVTVRTMKKYNNSILDKRTYLKFTPKGQGDAQEFLLDYWTSFAMKTPTFNLSDIIYLVSMESPTNLAVIITIQ